MQTIQTVTSEDSINSLCFLKDGRVVACTDSGVVIYKKNTYESDIVIKDEFVFSACGLKNGNLAYSFYSFIKIFEIDGKSHKLIHKLKEHKDMINKVIELENGKLCSCGTDNTLRIWDNNNNYKCIKVLKRDNEIFCESIIEINDYIVSPSCESTNIWNKSTYGLTKKMKKVFCSGRDAVSKLNDNTIILGGDNKIFSVDLLSFEFQTFCSDDFGIITTICLLRNGKLLVGNFEGKIFCFDLSLNKIISTQTIHKGEISRIIESETEDNKVFTSSYDGTININKLI